MRKKLFYTTLVIVLYTLFIVSLAKCEVTYEGPLSPHEFMNWQRVAQKVSPNGEQVLIRFINPNSQIDCVDALFAIDPNIPSRMLLLAYAFVFNNQVYIIQNDGKGHCKQISPKRNNV